ncbi:hypothetical protein ACRARG_07400 [Pseudooceanicola sp. C21-150M6]|uniref:hypothetical protein n=1 Tax=Pseudooceanicola sp. C21-150M6 TaxID=3434355 RepID=UPI003D7F4F32
MAAGAFDRALDALDDLTGQADPDLAGLSRTLSSLKETRPAELTAAQARRLIGGCTALLGIGPLPFRPAGGELWQLQRLTYQAEELLLGCFVDQGAEHRDFVQHSVTRDLAFGRTPAEGAPRAAVPLAHIALDRAEATLLMAPFLAAMERALAETPYAHLKFCWSVMEAPLPPFFGVVQDWLAGLDAKGRGQGSHQALARAFALVSLAREGKQKLTWANCEAQLLPQLEDPHPLVAGAAGRYLGQLYNEPERNFVRSAPEPMAWMLDHLRALPVNRRVVAGGFLDGLNVEFDGAFSRLRSDAPGYDIDGWVLDIFAEGEAEPYLPSAQSFWFYVHEEYAYDPPFVMRLIEAGHLWEAMMCATEAGLSVEGMRPVLERLAASPDEEIAGAARAALGASDG